MHMRTYKLAWIHKYKHTHMMRTYAQIGGYNINKWSHNERLKNEAGVSKQPVKKHRKHVEHDTVCIVCARGGQDVVPCCIGGCQRVVHRKCASRLCDRMAAVKCPQHACTRCSRTVADCDVSVFCLCVLCCVVLCCVWLGV